MKLYGFYLSRSVISRKNKKIRFDIWFSSLGIIIAVMTLTAALALFDGYTSTLKNSILNAYSHILIYPNIADLLDKEEIDSLTEFLQQKENVEGFAEVSAKQSMMTFDGKKIRGSYLKGIRIIDPGYREHINLNIDSHNLQLNNGEIILGHVLSRELNVTVGDTIRVINPSPDQVSIFGVRNSEMKLRVVDYYRTGMYEQDNTVGLITKEDFDAFFKDNGVSDWIEVVLNSEDVDKAGKISLAWSKEVFSDYQILPWSYFNSTLFSLLQWQKGLLFIIMLFLVLIASFNLISSVSATILDRKFEIGIMKAVGCSDAMLKRIHLGNYLGLSILSIVIGIVSGIGLAFVITRQTLLGISGDVYFIDKLTMQIRPEALVVIFISSLIIIIVSTLFPLKQISRMEVSEILRERS